MRSTAVRKRWHRWFQTVNGRPLAAICSGYLTGAAVGVTLLPLSAIQACVLAVVVGWVSWRYRLLSTAVAWLGSLALCLGLTQGIRYARQDDYLWHTLPRDEVVVADGYVATEPARKAGVWRFVFHAESIAATHSAIRTPVRLWVHVPETLLEAVFAGERLRLEGRLRMPLATQSDPSASFARYLRRQGISRTLRPYRIVHLPQRHWSTSFSRLRRALIRNLRLHLPTQEGHIAAAIALNDRVGLGDAIRESFRRTGTVHILSPSGTHVSMLAVAAWAVCRFIGLSRRASALAVIVIIWLFAAVAAGGDPSVRAAVMGTLVAGASALQRENDLPTSLALAGFLIVLADTSALRDPSFQFSFTLVAAIVASAGWLKTVAAKPTGRGSYPLRVMLAAAWLSVVCTIASAPLSALYYGQVSLVAPIANLVIALPVQVVTSAGVAIACLPSLPEVFAMPIAASAWMVDRSVRLLASPPWASVEASAPSRWTIVALYTVLFAVLLVLSERASRRKEEAA
ncbi:MAG: ComEC/Rec2 family competence protein [Armatimonadota bacterium]|nr:ComEC/Rec2 family competence protein [Armatimonadota bacterium]